MSRSGRTREGYPPPVPVASSEETDGPIVAVLVVRQVLRVVVAVLVTSVVVPVAGDDS